MREAVTNEWKKGRRGRRVPVITAPDAGFVPKNGGNTDHSGSGWNIVMDERQGDRLAHHNVPLNASESGTLCEMAPEVGQVLDKPEVRVLTTDGAFHSQETRRALRGVVENTHLSSHANRASTRRKANERTRKRYVIDGC